MNEIKEKSNFPEIGSTINIDVDSIKDKLPEGLKRTLYANSIGKVIDYKITDGTEIGFLVELCDSSKQWFFNHEIDGLSDNIKTINLSRKKINIAQESFYTGDNITYVLNPINFAKWLIGVTNDIL